MYILAKQKQRSLTYEVELTLVLHAKPQLVKNNYLIWQLHHSV